ncbi:hypothetical protein RND81_03G021700 [Saponaria officinalis]|uniref:TTF-type domain-containing protein n=1 Tax=Saponaria officinalis TaxID=3572 RepID=A0AAW1M4R4_SAPOF
MTDNRNPKRYKNLFSWFKNDSSPSISVDQREEIELQDDQHKRASNQEGQHEQQEDVQDYNITSLKRDPGKRRAIGIYPLNEQDNVRRAYVVLGPYQPYINDYPCTQHGNQGRKFSHRWFKEWPWLEYSLDKDSVYCFPCFLFDEYPSRHPSFTEIGFNGWKNVMSKQSGITRHIGGIMSIHNASMRKWENLRNPSKHIERVINKLSEQELANNRQRSIQ